MGFYAPTLWDGGAHLDLSVCWCEQKDTCRVPRTIDNSKFYSFHQNCWVLSMSCWYLFLTKEVPNIMFSPQDVRLSVLIIHPLENFVTKVEKCGHLFSIYLRYAINTQFTRLLL